MLLASIGIYGVLAPIVGQRSREIGIRMALGARPGDILRMFLRKGRAGWHGHRCRIDRVGSDGVPAWPVCSMVFARMIRRSF